MSDDEDQEQDQELIELQEHKAQLLRRAVELKNEMEAWDKAAGKSSGKTEKDFLPPTKEFCDLITENGKVERVNKKCLAISSYMMGVKFNCVDKKWISDRKYMYTANVKSKALEFVLEVTVDGKDAAKGLEVVDVVCHFVNLRKCYFLEITSWISRFTKAKDTNNLFSAVSDYTEHNVLRTKILRNLQERNSFSTAEECSEGEGGIMIVLHDKNDPDFVYFEIRWALTFVESLWRIDNLFTIQPISAGDDFLEANGQLLQRFCKPRITETDLEDMWEKLFSSVEQDDTSQSIAGTITS